MMRVGILGSGFMGITHARAFAKLPDVEVGAVSSRTLANAEKVAVEVGARATADDMNVIHDPTIDVISNTLPTHLHPSLTIAALQAGKHVLLEKPFALTVEDCDAIMDAHAKSSAHLMIAHVLRFWPEYEGLIEAAHSGAYGRLLSGVATRLSTFPAWATWFTNPAISGGAVLDLMVHDIDALNWVFGMPKSIYARGQEYQPGLWNHIHATVDYGEAQGVIEGSLMMPKGYPFTSALRVLCEGGSLEYLFRAEGISLDTGGGSQTVAYTAERMTPIPVPSGDAFERQIAYFVDCVRSNRAPERGTPAASRLAVKMCNAARQSLETGIVVAL